MKRRSQFPPDLAIHLFWIPLIVLLIALQTKAAMFIVPWLQRL